MNRKYISWSAILLAGTCVGIAPAWSASSSSSTTGSSSSDQSQQQGSMGTSSDSSSTAPGHTTDSNMMKQRSGSHMSRQGNVKQVQEALKDKGFDPGPIDGVMGQKTQEALKSFQQSKNLKVTGRLDSETAQQLGVGSSTSGTSSSNMGASGSSSKSNMGTSDSTVGSEKGDTSKMPAGSTRGSETGSGH